MSGSSRLEKKFQPSLHQSGLESTNEKAPVTSKLFKYRPLEDPEKQIRLFSLDEHGWLYTFTRALSLDEAETRISISGCLNHVSLNDDIPEYVALSYTWGSPDAPLRISVDGSCLEVTANLHSVLKVLAKLRHLRGRPLWIDAICIDQKDDKEKSFQVPLMGHIFSQASEVLAWIGDEEDGSCDVLYTLAALGGHFESQNSASTMHTTRWSAQQKALRRANLDQTRKLFMRAWWHRVWVIQEVTLARSAHVMCGTRLFPWTNIVTGLGYFELKHQTFSKFGWDSEFREIYGPVEHFLIFRESLQRAQLDAREDSQEHAECDSKNKTKGKSQDSAAFESFSETGLTLEEALECLMRLDDENLEASNDKDRVYAFLAFLPRRTRALIPVDYSKSTKMSHILDEITWVMFQRHGPRILACSRSSPARAKGLSSWHIDWTRINLDFAMYDPIGNPRSGVGAEWFLRASETNDDRSRIPIEGIKLSTVGMFASFDMETLSSVKALSQSHDSSRVKALKTWMKMMKNLVEKSSVNEPLSTSRRSSMDDLWLVAIAGYQHNRLLAGSSLLSKYDPLQTKPSCSEPLMKLRYHCDLCDIDADDASALSESEVQKLRRDWESRHLQRLHENFQIMMDEVEPNEEADFHTAVMSYWRRLRINGNKGFVTPNGRAGLGPETMRTDDLIVIFKGCEFPFVIRPSCKERKEYELVGACYVDGIMDGEAMKDNPEFEEMFLV